MKQIMKHQSLLSGIKSLGIMLSLGLALASCTKDDVVQDPAKPNEEGNKNLTTFVAGGENKTRTSMDYNSGNFYWEAGDYIYVKDDNGDLKKSTNAPTGKVASFNYKVPGKFTDHSSYEVYYFGKNSSNNQVVIPSAQSQSTPNNTEHFGVSGDYGTATATGSVGGKSFSFQLEHQAAYLVFHPYVSNTLLQNCSLTKIEVSSDNDIASTYTLNTSTGTLQSVSTGTGKEIILSTKGSGAYANGFPLNTASDNVAVNGAYMVIKPGTHTLKVRYWLKDGSTGIEGTVTKAFKAFNYDVNNYYDIDGNLNIRDYDGDHYYMWDAQEQYWKGHEWNHGGSQPTLNYDLPNATTSSDYAQSNTDPRYYNASFPGNGISNPATHASCKDLPNANELTWYATGEPRWDADELWTTMGHLYKGGMWFKKKSVLQAEGHYNSNTAVDGTDWRTTTNVSSGGTWAASQTLPSAADAGNYFYLPALGYYDSGQLREFGDLGFYWSSSAFSLSSYGAYGLDFSSGLVGVNVYDRPNGLRVGGFE